MSIRPGKRPSRRARARRDDRRRYAGPAIGSVVPKPSRIGDRCRYRDAVVVRRGRVAVGAVHQLKVTLREARPPVWRRVHVPSEASLAELHEVIQVAMGWEQHYLHLFGTGDREYGDNARGGTAVTPAGLIPQAGEWLGYRYDLGVVIPAVTEVEDGAEGRPDRPSARTTPCPRCEPCLDHA
ncbi:plasmid pRiA4b ORF-3 family protein [Streptosporangium sp. NPDC000396]|uniref:plasmid pRiA4b ORF-3 family protein n=1 Tax=Streptosporangium sp. NPDC000396 TaxID=3366185 RepID=UPI0036B36A66